MRKLTVRKRALCSKDWKLDSTDLPWYVSRPAGRGYSDKQHQAQNSTSEAPAGQRTIPKFERHTQSVIAKSGGAVEGIEKPMKAMAI
jgi:hypothetical protein